MNKKRIAALVAILLLLALPLAFRQQTYAFVLLVFIGIYIVAGTGLDLLFGYSGQISLGQAGFYAIGAYVSALLSIHTSIPVFFAMLIGALVAMFIGIVIAYPASKLVHHFLALSTIAFGELVHLLIVHSPGEITNGFSGIAKIPPLSLFGFALDSNLKYYYFVLAVAILVLFVKQRVVCSKTGRCLIAIRDDAQAASSSGINVRKYRVMAFALSALFTGYAGAMYAHAVHFISPETFTLNLSIILLTIVLFGGMSTFLGPIVGAVIVILIKEVLQVTGNYQTLIYGIFLLVVLLFMPQGVAPFFQNLKIWKRKEVSVHAEN